jgi:myo-inositol-1(or 4)-monophosphatase
MDFILDSIRANEEIISLLNSIKPEYYEYLNIGMGGDRSLKIDILAESIFVKYLSKYGQIVSEESGFIGSGEKKIILDPIDGSGNFFCQIAYYGTSIALVNESGDVEIGIITNLISRDIFIKTKTSFKIGKIGSLIFQDIKTRASKIGIFEKSYSNPLLVQKLNELNCKFRTPGALALSLANAHFVDFVMFIGAIREFDVKAGFFMCENLYKYITEDSILISKDKAVFEKLKNIL